MESNKISEKIRRLREYEIINGRGTAGFYGLVISEDDFRKLLIEIKPQDVSVSYTDIHDIRFEDIKLFRSRDIKNEEMYIFRLDF